MKTMVLVMLKANGSRQFVDVFEDQALKAEGLGKLALETASGIGIGAGVAALIPADQIVRVYQGTPDQFRGEFGPLPGDPSAPIAQPFMPETNTASIADVSDRELLEHISEVCDRLARRLRA